MQQQDVGVVQNEGGDWRLSLGPVRVHHNHLQVGISKAERCGLCSEGLAAILEVVPRDEAPAPVVESDGADEEGDAAPPSDNWPV